MNAKTILIVAVTLLAIGDPAETKVNIACKSEVGAIGRVSPTQSKAGKAARSKWAERVAAKYGPSWSHLVLARNMNLTCRGGDNRWACKFDARPCGKVSYPTPKAHQHNPALVRP